MSINDELKGMVMTFRVSELQMLLGYASQNKTGRKSELQTRALSLLKNKSVPHLTQIQAKIRELYKTIQQGVVQNVPPPEGLGAMIGSRNQQPSIQPPPPIIPPTPPPSVPPPPQAQFMPLSNRQMYGGSLYGYQPKLPVSQAPPAPSYPIHPDVRIKRLPFYDILGEIIKPSSLAPSRNNESAFIFYLTPQQATEVATNREVGPGTKNEYSVQVQLRFCLLETSCEQEDIFPPGICVKVNGKLAQLPNPVPTNRPGVEPKRPPRPVNISNLVKLSPSVSNHVSVSWTPDYTRGYVLVVHLVRKLTAQDLLNRLKSRGSRHADFTTGLIKEKLAEDNDCEIATTSLRVSLLCPLGKMRMSVPARSSYCSHLQCFDASLFLQMNEKRPTWSCPVCDKSIAFDSLVIDGYFQDVLNSSNVPSDVHEVQLHKDGSWSCSQVKPEDPKVEASSVAASPKNEIEEILDDSDEVAPAAKTEPPVAKKVIEIDLTASDSEDEAPPPVVVKEHVLSDSSNSSGGFRSSGRTTETPTIISLDSPSPPPSTSPPPPAAATTYPEPPRLYPQVVPTNRPLIMQIRMPPDTGRYHPY